MSKIRSVKRPGMLIAAVILASPAHAVDRLVPSQYPAIRPALAACAASGDRIVLADGIYTGSDNCGIDLGTKNVVIASASGVPGACIIDGQTVWQLFRFTGGQNSSAGLSGLTLRRGETMEFAGGGGAVQIVDSHCTITNCIVENCYGFSGGGIRITGASAPVISNCIFRNNNAFGNGGGIFAEGSSSIVNCVFYGNAVHATFLARGNGGGAFVANSASVHCCTFYDNEADDPGFDLTMRDTTSVLNTILWSVQPLRQDSGNVAFCNISASSPLPDANGNFGLNPHFLDPGNGNFYLGAGSPCIDRGFTFLPSPPYPTAGGVVRDLLGNPRLYGAAVDIGAVERQAVFQPAYNDACTNAITASDSFVYLGDIQTATLDGSSSCQPTSRDVWFRFVSTRYQRLRVLTCGSEFDTVLSLHTGTCPSLVEVACSDDSPAGDCDVQSPTALATMTATVNAGTTYYIRLSPKGALLGGTGIYRFNMWTEHLAENDDCAAATVVSPGGTYSGYTDNTSTDGTAPCQESNSDVWFSYTPFRNQTISFETCGSSYDTVLSVHTGACGALTSIACNDDAPAGTPGCMLPPPLSSIAINSKLDVTLNAGTRYLIRVAARGPANGGFIGNSSWELHVGQPVFTPIDLHVPGQYPTIQAAIDSAVTGDRVVLAPGTYTGPGNRDVSFRSKNITLVSSTLDPSTCRIDCQQAGRGLFIDGGQTAACRVEGIQISNGHLSSGFAGAGAAIVGSSPTFHNCIFQANVTSSNNGGGGVYLFNSSSRFTNCSFINNSAAAGGGVYSDTSSPSIINCLFSGNTATQRGGGIFLIGGSPVVRNCTVTANSANGAGGGGGGVYMTTGTAANCILFGNTAPILPNLEQTGGLVTFSNIGESFIPAGTTPNADGNLNADPRFANITGQDYRLAFDSPCLNRGSNTLVVNPPYPTGVGGGTIDRLGNPRIQGGTVDMGAYEGVVIPDTCVGAQPIFNGSTPFDMLLGSPVVEPSPTCAPTPGPSLWYAYTSPCSSTVTVSTCSVTFDSVVMVYTGPCSTLNMLACNDDGPSFCSGAPASNLTFNAIAGQTYAIRITGFQGARGAGTLLITCCPADFNRSGAVTVQDIFDFLAAYFANTAIADFNRSGGISVQDIFDFLAAYFSGCP